MLKFWAESPTQPPEITCKNFQQALSDYENSGNQLARPYFQAILVGLLKNAGQFKSAQQIIESTLLETTNTGEEFFTAELFRLKGELALTQNPPDYSTAETFFIQAYEHANHQKSNSLALRAIISLTHLLTVNTKKNNTPYTFQTSLANTKKQLENLLNQFSDDERTADTAAAEQLLASLVEHTPV